MVALYRKAIRLWWTYDDAFHIHVSVVRSWTDAFTESDIGPHRLFVPLLLAAHEALLELAGLDADTWYRVQLALLAACAIAVFAALRLYVTTLPALAGALTFIAGPALCSVITQLMAMHYLQAILLAALSVIAWVVGVRRRSIRLEVLSAALYLAAMLAKEIAVPLPVLLFVLPRGAGVPPASDGHPARPRWRWARRPTHAGGTPAPLFHLIALVVYLAWRWWALGTLLGGYGWAVTSEELPRFLATLPWRVIVAAAGSALGIGLVAMALLAAVAARTLRTRRALIAGLITLAMAVAPIVPVSKEMQPRYAVMAWLWLCVAFAIGIATLPAKIRHALIVATLAVVMVANRQEWARVYARANRMSAEARAFVSHGAADMLRRPAIPPAAMGELQWLKEEHLGGPRGAGWFYDDLVLCNAASLDGKRIYEWIPAQRTVLEVTKSIPLQAKRYCSSIRERAPLRTEFRYRDETLFWRFGPYEEGRWSVILAGGLQAFEVPREDGFLLHGVPGLTLRVRYASPEGWVTYSPEITIDFARQPDLVWHR